MKKIFLCLAFCLFLLPAVAFGSPQQQDTTPAIQIQQQTLTADTIDKNSIAGNNEPDLTPLQSGCCSWHGGVAGCSNGRVVCNDGRYSPSCRC